MTAMTAILAILAAIVVLGVLVRVAIRFVLAAGLAAVAVLVISHLGDAPPRAGSAHPQDGRVIRVGAIEIETHNATTTLARAAAANDATGLPWLLVYEDDQLERKAIQRVLGDRTELAARNQQMCVRRIVPPAR